MNAQGQGSISQKGRLKPALCWMLGIQRQDRMLLFSGACDMSVCVGGLPFPSLLLKTILKQKQNLEGAMPRLNFFPENPCLTCFTPDSASSGVRPARLPQPSALPLPSTQFTAQLSAP